MTSAFDIYFQVYVPVVEVAVFAVPNDSHVRSVSPKRFVGRVAYVKVVHHALAAAAVAALWEVANVVEH